MRRLGSHYKQGTRRSQVLLSLVLTVSIAIVGAVVWWFFANTEVKNETTSQQTTTAETEQTSETEQPDEPIVAEKPKEQFDQKQLKDALETWAASTAGQASVVLMGVEGDVIASVEPDQQYFTASIYKLYVAYEGYIQIDEKVVDPDEIYINGHTREECLHLMIKESDSPCAEKLWSELGKEKLNTKIIQYGIENTSMIALNTTASDVAIMLSRIAISEGLSAESQARLLASMKDQIYRDALNKGFSERVIVYNKIGFNGQVEYHDTAIVEFSDGRQLIVSVLTERVGTTNIAKLAEAVEKAASY